MFFGENVPPDAGGGLLPRWSRRAGALLVLGSSLTVMSGFRFVRQAAKLDIPVVIVNQGATRGDELATANLDAPLGPTLTRLLACV